MSRLVLCVVVAAAAAVAVVVLAPGAARAGWMAPGDEAPGSKVPVTDPDVPEKAAGGGGTKKDEKTVSVTCAPEARDEKDCADTPWLWCCPKPTVCPPPPPPPSSSSPPLTPAEAQHAPEPSSLALLASGALGLAWLRRRGRRGR